MKFTSFFSKIFFYASAFTVLISANTLAAETVAVYTAAPQKLIDTLVPAFEKQSGIKVEIVKAGSGELLNRPKLWIDFIIILGCVVDKQFLVKIH